MKYLIILSLSLVALAGCSAHNATNQAAVTPVSDVVHRQASPNSVSSQYVRAPDSSSVQLDNDASEAEPITPLGVPQLEPAPAPLTESEPLPEPTPVEPPVNYNQAVPVASSHFVEFDQALYDQAVAQGQPIWLYFYASWCPTCRAQHPTVNELWGNDAELKAWGAQGFFVNYNDSDTSPQETALAQQFGITYQHTFVVLKGSEVTAKTFGSRSASQIKSDIATAL